MCRQTIRHWQLFRCVQDDNQRMCCCSKDAQNDRHGGGRAQGKFLLPRISTSLFLLDPKLIAEEVAGRKWLQHKNILPFVGVNFTPLPISIVSALMENGNIMNFIKANQRYNRMSLVSKGEYLFLRWTYHLDSL